MKIETISGAYDHLFAGRATLPWWPWIGSHFEASTTKTMIVGESVYRWQPESKVFEERYARPDGLRITHTNHALQFDRVSPYVRNVERAIFRTARPSHDQKNSLWSSVAYHNLVLRPLASSHVRPSDEDYRTGWTELLDLCDLLDIGQCLVYGLESPKRQALKYVAAQRQMTCAIQKVGPKIGSHQPRVARLTMGDRQLKLLFIRHPSAFFSWKRWAPIVGDHLPLGL
ncbi:hypothetical protein CURE108131_19155 [Cupriavidus respiraculi]|uniref:Uncharacterized protein n=1 Tax=Cupriavidus respiraculi TaxID=195930 RepID=A0ABM8XU33_9BURK|nr:hypothetical protein [Cupriavidus respiraculi]MBY4949509.1 hypothetical protein [Cupriavidus respiraculi]CAG9183877.1 hypothetical protein LMG21510_04967 [Cupriavidus respiraculi]